MSVDQQFHSDHMARRLAAAQATVPPAKPTPKPTAASSWDDPAFADRVIARAERRQRILAQIRSKPKAYVSAGDVVRELITQLMQTKGIDRSAAMRFIAKDRPDLLESMRLEANPQQNRGWRR